ncbi:MAG: CDP-alcohol phosphatidyltransferase family protein [Micromonosporaceae bacterium]|nr:CDP-alcohol phosphatidyltransferase family protein [Micromonosporaceae bacterium]
MGTPQLTVDTWDGYAARWSAVHGGLDPRRATWAIRGWLRLAYLCGRPLARQRISANTLTSIGLLGSVAAPLVMLLGPGWATAAGAFVLVTALAGTVDGAVAVITGRATPWGTVYQAAACRIGEACWLTALWLAGAPSWLVVGACGVAWLHEYVRLQATLVGANRAATVTMAELPMRVSVSAAGLALSGVAHLVSAELAIGAATMAATVWLLLGVGGLIQLGDAVNTVLKDRRP